MKDLDKISPSVIRRLPRYYRYLTNLEKEGVSRISSKALSETIGVTASQIRQDLNCFGGFGQQGYGYNISELRREIADILDIKSSSNTILVGAGNLGRAVATHMPFEDLGFSLIGIFDSAPMFKGLKIKNLQISPMTEIADFCIEKQPQVAILCIPDDSAKQIVEELWGFGIRAFWNFTHYNILADYPTAVVENVHLSDSLMTLSYQLKFGIQ